jgi:hypothetical protein
MENTMGIYLYSPDGSKEFFKDAAKSNEMVAAGYTFELQVEEEDNPLTKRQVIAKLKELGVVEYDKSLGVSDLRLIVEDIERATGPGEE